VKKEPGSASDAGRSQKKPKDDEFAAYTSEQLFADGIRMFNEQEFYDCHEVLEALWNREQEPEKQFTQGIIQIAVGLYHYLRGNLAGANKLIPRGLERIRPFSPEHKGLAVNEFIASVDRVRHNVAIAVEQQGRPANESIELPKLLKINI
jgi:predicted metal-dependent hydrolase